MDIRVPELGESITESQIGRWLRSEGDEVRQDDPLVELESDKAQVELPSPGSGRIVEILKREGDTVQVGEVIGRLEAGDGDGRTAQPAAPASRKASPPAAQQSQSAAQSEEKGRPQGSLGATSRRAAASAEPQPATEVEAEVLAERASPQDPSADAETPRPATVPAGRQDEPRHDDPALSTSTEVEPRPRLMPDTREALARHGLQPEQVKGTGPAGRILPEDVERHVREAGAPKARVEVAAESRTESRGEEVVPMTMLRRRIAARLVEAQHNAALLTTFNEVDMSAVLAFRKEHGEAFQKQHGIKLGLMSFFIKAAVEALKRVPQINAEVRETEIVYKHYYDVGVAVSTDHGLVVPVLRDADQLSFMAIEQRLADLSNRARAKKLALEELQGGTFTITNGGIFGSLLSTPIVNPPQSAILGMHTIQDRPVARQGEVVIRPMMYVALTYDHRLIDGKEAVTFLVQVKQYVEDPMRMLIGI